MAAGDYVDLDDVKDVLGITDTNEDTLLNSFKIDTNQEIEFRLRPFADSLPLTSDFFTYAKKAGVYYMVSCYKTKNYNFEAGNEFMKKFEKKLSFLIDALKAIPTTRTKLFMASQRYDTEDDILFSQRII